MLRLTQAKEQQYSDWAYGIYVRSATGQDLDDLREQAVVDRLRLATDFLAAAEALMKARPPRYRDAISRYYYAMYHSIRAAALFSHQGDDQSTHAELPGRTPGDFPNTATRQNELKNARALRNQADYDPYPADEVHWKAQARLIRPLAASLLGDVRAFLLSKGCRHL